MMQNLGGWRKGRRRERRRNRERGAEESGSVEAVWGNQGGKANFQLHLFTTTWLK